MTYLVIFLNLIEITQISYWAQDEAGTAFSDELNTLISYGVFLLNIGFIFFHSPTLPNPIFRLGVLPVILLLIWAFFAVIPSVMPFRALTAALKLTVSFYLFTILFSKRRAITLRAMRDFIVFFAFANLGAVFLLPDLGLEHQITSRTEDWRGFLPYKTQLGTTSVILFSILFFGSKEIRTMNIFLYTSVLLALVFLILGSQSRMSWFSLGTILLVYVFFVMMHAAGRKYRYAIFLFFVAISFGVYQAVSYFAISLIESSGRDLTFSGRIQIWEFFIDAGMQRPVFGYGMAVSGELVDLLNRAYSRLGWDDFTSAHNSVIGWLMNCGIIGAVLFMAVLLSVLCIGIKDAWRDPGRSGMRNLALAIIILVTSIFTSNASVSGAVWFAMFFVFLVDARFQVFRLFPRKDAYANAI